MASREVRALIVVAVPGIRGDARCALERHGAATGAHPALSAPALHRLGNPPSGRSAQRGGKIPRPVLAVFALLTCASIHHVARAHVAPDGAVFVPADGEFGPCADGDRELGRATPEVPHYQQDMSVPPTCDLAVLEPDDSEQGRRGTEGLVVNAAADVAPTLGVANQGVRAAPVGWATRRSLSPALPRGPPFASP